MQTNAVLRVVAISVGYLILWIGLNLLATGFSTSKAINPWYLSGALTFYLLYTCGAKYAPLGIVAEMIRAYIPLGPHVSSPPVALVFGIMVTAGYAGAAYVAKDTLRINLPFIGLRDAARFTAVAALAPLCIGAVLMATLCAMHTVSWTHYFDRVLTFWVGDTVGLFVLVPVLATYVTPRLASWTVSPEARDDEVPISLTERVVLYVILVVSMILGYATFLTGISQHPLLYFTFLPLVWMASRGGLRVAVPAIVCADVATTILNAAIPGAENDALEMQSYIVVSAMTALLVGALVNGHHRRERQSRLRALRDPLTGLANRASLETWIASAPLPFMLMVLDIDRLKLANDGLSRADGDELLLLVAQRLQFLEAPFVGHVAPDEFACAFSGDRGAAELATEVLSLFEEPFAVEENEVYVSATMGVAAAFRDGDRPMVLRRADLAMYRIKRSGRHGYGVYTPALETADTSVSLASDLYRALREREFVLHYQPLFRVDAGVRTCIGAEALLRWNHPQLGLLGPAAFLDLLESLALAERVGEWVTAEACRQLRVWLDHGLDMSVWVNVFPRQALDSNFPPKVATALLEHRIKPERLVLEIVERVFAEDESQVGDAIRNLASLGVRIAIDDFGTGHSSLARLRESPAHIMKIDGSFINRSEVDPRARGVVHAVLQIAQELRITPLAEGIENEAQLRLVTDQGCKLVQGYYLSRPLPAAELEHLLLGVVNT